MKINIPAPAASIIAALSSHGYEAYVVGGCVRDSILGLEPADWDITTNAKPDQVKEIFPRTIDTGLKHGTVTIMVDKTGYEVTTYRIDGVYEDCRRPKDVTFTDDLKEDLMRRDFTINAMAYNDEKGLIDIFGGEKDLEDKVIRCVGDPNDRFNEDALRMMRAVRFAAQLHFSIDKATEEAIRANAPLLANVSAERIRVELTKLLNSRHPDMLKAAWATGLTTVFLPEFDLMMETPQENPHHCYNVGDHTLHALLASAPDPWVRLAVLLHDVGKPDVRTTDEQGIDHFYTHPEVSAEKASLIMRRLKFDNETIHKVGILIRYHDIRFSDACTTGRKHVRRTMNKVGADLFSLLLDVMEADISAQSDYMRMHKLMNLKEARTAYQEILAAQDCLTIKDLKINGNDLKAMGLEEGKLIGSILETLLTLVLDHPEYNDHDYLCELAGRIHKELDANAGKETQ